MSKAQVKSIIAAIGDDAITERLGVNRHSIRHARFTGLFPASWYAEILTLCQEAGVSCPLDVFNFKTPSEASVPEVLACPAEHGDGPGADQPGKSTKSIASGDNPTPAEGAT